jgi:chromosomal replication initiator protein
MDVQTGIAPRSLEQAFADQRSLIPDDAEVLDRLFAHLEQSRPTMAETRQAVCEFYAITREELVSPTRRCAIVLARQIFCYLAHKYCRASLHATRTRVGYRDHTTVLHAIRKIARLAITRPLLRDDLDLLRLRISEKVLLRSRGRVQ